MRPFSLSLPIPTPHQATCVRTAVLILLLDVSSATTILRAEDREFRPDIRASFKFDPDDDCLLIPVRIGGKEYPFVVDTGMPSSLVDSSLRRYLGKSVGETGGRSVAGGGELHIDTRSSPNATVGSLRFTPETVLCQDLTFIRETSGYDVYGLLGLDFLAEWIVSIDFDKGCLDMLSPATLPKPEWGERVRVAYKASSLWYIPVTFGESRRPSFFMVDTGCSNTGSLEKTLFRQLVDSRDIKLTGESRFAGLTGDSTESVGRILRSQVATFEHRNLRLSCSPQDNVLGLGYLRRYRVTFDFPAERLFFVKGKHFADHDPGSMCGTHLLFKKQGVVVECVDEKSPAYTAGVRARDVLIALSGKPVSQLKPSVIRHLLKMEGKSITMTLDRNGKKVEATFTLKELD
jgi:hypothetical protein